MELDDRTSILTLMLGLAFSKPLMAVCVCCPSVPRPDSANTMVCLALAETAFDEPPELPHAASPSAAAASAAAGASARRRRALDG